MVKTSLFELQKRIDEAKRLVEKARETNSMDELAELLEGVKRQRRALKELSGTDMPNAPGDKRDN